MKRQLEIQLVNLIFDIQRQNRFIEDAYGTGLSLLDSHILLDLLSEQLLTPGELSVRLRVPKSLLTNRIRSLLENSYVLKAPSRKDGRSYHLSLSSEGKKFLETYHQVAEAGLQERLSTVSEKDRGIYTIVLRRFAEAYSAAFVQEIAAVSPLRREVIRLTRQMGLLGSKVFGIEGITSLHLQLLYHVEQYGEINASVLREFLSCKSSTLSNLISRLIEGGTLLKSPNPEDRRQQLISITAAGELELNAIRSVAVETLCELLQGWSNADKAMLVEVLVCLARGPGVSEKHPYLFLYSVRELTEEVVLQQARRFLLEHWYSEKQEVPLPGSFLSSNSVVLGLYDGKRLCAILECATDGPTAYVYHAAYAGIRVEFMHAFMDTALVYWAANQQIDSIILSDSILQECVPVHWSILQKRDGTSLNVSLIQSEIPGWDR